MSFFLLSHKSAVGRIMLLEVTIRYLVELLIESTSSCVLSLMWKLALKDLKFSLQVGVTTEGWWAVNRCCRLFGCTFFNCWSWSRWRFFCCSCANSLLAWLRLQHVASFHCRSNFNFLLGRDAVVSTARALLSRCKTLILAYWIFGIVEFFASLFC